MRSPTWAPQAAVGAEGRGRAPVGRPSASDGSPFDAPPSWSSGGGLQATWPDAGCTINRVIILYLRPYLGSSCTINRVIVLYLRPYLGS